LPYRRAAPHLAARLLRPQIKRFAASFALRLRKKRRFSPFLAAERSEALAFAWNFGELLSAQASIRKLPLRKSLIGGANIRRKAIHRGAIQRERRMNKLELVEHVAKEADISKASAAAALEATLDGIAKSLKKGDEVRLVGFGTFSVRERAAGKGRNPATGTEIKIPASKNARFKAGASLKATLNKKSAIRK
jgi:DNA-binding protein HU-beta